MYAFEHAAEVGTLRPISDASATHWRMGALREAADESHVEVFRGTNHSKFVLVDKLATGEEWVVYTTSGNFTKHQRKWEQTTVVHVGNQALYDSYLEYWESLRVGKPWVSSAGTDMTLTYANTHSKWMAIDKVGERSRAYVYTGSANINERTHEAADSTLRLKGRAIYDAFRSEV